MKPLLLIAVTGLLLPPTLSASGRRETQQPGTVTLTWTVRWPRAGHQRVYLKKLQARPGLIKSVRVLIGGTFVVGPPNISIVGCQGTRNLAAAQKAWLWDGRNVYVSLLLSPARCEVAETIARVTAIIHTVGT